MSKCIYTFFLLLCFAKTHSQTRSIDLNTNWLFRQKGTPLWLGANVPGNVHQDLIKYKQIKDPFYSDNEKDVQWVETMDWEYKTVLACDKTLLQNKHIEIVFEGLDTYAKVYLNDSLILKANNMFRSWTIDVKKFLKAGNNTLYILFESSVKKGKEDAAKLKYTLPEGERIFTRKAQYQYGWDWGPRLVTCGIWKPVRLLVWNELKIISLNYDIIELTENEAKVNFNFQIIANEKKEYDFEIISLSLRENIKKSKNISLEKGINSADIEVSIPKPRLWWCHSMGEQHLYPFGVIIKSNDVTVQKDSLIVGLRTIELVRQPDAYGTSFYFLLNGKPVFMKGANYIPPDNFLARVTKTNYNEDIKLAKAANMNMLRVWGGGVYGSNEFYEACDKEGILVWQDFMFACAMYPGSKDFFDNVSAEVKEQCSKVKNHPSLALWCGNNEINEAWNNWGWQKQFKYSATDSAKIWNDYKLLFDSLIPKVKNSVDSRIPYWPSSPSIGWGHEESLKNGDSHYWGVWWGNEPFETYNKKVGRFMSEYGFQSMPSLNTLNKFTPKEQMNLNSPAIKAHQKHKTGFETITRYMERDYKVPSHFYSYAYVSQLLQRDGMRAAIEAHRRGKPNCMGTLFWQFNDCWPVTSWSCLDYYKQPKAFYYDLKQLYKTNFISVFAQKTGLQITVGTDSLQRFDAVVSVSLKDFNGRTFFKKDFSTQLNNSYCSIIPFVEQEYSFCNQKESYLDIYLVSQGKKLAHKRYFFVKSKELNLQLAAIKLNSLEPNTISISSDLFAKDVYLYCEDTDYEFSENFFDLESGENKMIKVNSKNGNFNLSNIKFLTLNNL